MSKSKKNALCGLCAALSVVIMMLMNVITIASYTLVMIAALILLFCYIECGSVHAVLVYVATSLLAMLFVQDRAGVLLYVVIFGIIALLKPKLDGISKKLLRIISKISLYIACAGVYYFVTAVVFGIELYESTATVWLIMGAEILALFVDVIFDIVATQLLFLYFKRYRKYIDKFLK